MKFTPAIHHPELPICMQLLIFYFEKNTQIGLFKLSKYVDDENFMRFEMFNSGILIVKPFEHWICFHRITIPT